MRWNEPAPLELILVNYMERFGWTPDEIEDMPVKWLHTIAQVDDGKAKAHQEADAFRAGRKTRN